MKYGLSRSRLSDLDERGSLGHNLGQEENSIINHIENVWICSNYPDAYLEAIVLESTTKQNKIDKQTATEYKQDRKVPQQHSRRLS